jgi:hypothetical protein
VTRRAQQREKVEQAHTMQLLDALGCEVWVLGTRRRHTDHQGTMQSPGLPDLIAFLPCHIANPDVTPRRRLLVVESKAAGGRLSFAQKVFQRCCLEADVAHVVGDYDAVVAWLLENAYLRPESVPHYRLKA